MKLIKHWRRIAIVFGGLGATLAALAGSASAATGMLPASGGGGTGTVAAVPVVVAGGMPGWQIALIAVGAALVAAVVAVLLDRARLARRPLAAKTA
jgi:ABC-type cobalamin transport system permease subunit